MVSLILQKALKNRSILEIANKYEESILKYMDLRLCHEDRKNPKSCYTDNLEEEIRNIARLLDIGGANDNALWNELATRSQSVRNFADNPEIIFSDYESNTIIFSEKYSIAQYRSTCPAALFDCDHEFNDVILKTVSLKLNPDNGLYKLIANEIFEIKPSKLRTPDCNFLIVLYNLRLERLFWSLSKADTELEKEEKLREASKARSIAERTLRRIGVDSRKDIQDRLKNNAEIGKILNFLPSHGFTNAVWFLCFSFIVTVFFYSGMESTIRMSSLSTVEAFQNKQTKGFQRDLNEKVGSEKELAPFLNKIAADKLFIKFAIAESDFRLVPKDKIRISTLKFRDTNIKIAFDGPVSKGANPVYHYFIYGTLFFLLVIHSLQMYRQYLEKAVERFDDVDLDVAFAGDSTRSNHLRRVS